MSTETSTISDSDCALIKTLRERLDAHGYRAENFDDTEAFTSTLPLLEYRFNDDSPLSMLARLFLLGLEVDAGSISRIFDEEEIKHLIALEILQEYDDRLKSRLKIHPYKHLNLFCDFLHKSRHADQVYNPGGDSVILADAGVRLPFGSALDLCTGSGIQAIMASEHTTRTVGVDINPRAVHIARLNLLLNGIDNLTVKEGNLYEPVASESFDFITANPPFVTTHVKTGKYRDGGLRGDDILFKILEGIPAHLNDGGFCQIVTHLYEFEDLSHIEAMRAFAEEHGYEALIFLSAPFDKYELVLSQYKNLVGNYENYRKQALGYLEHLDQIRYIKGFLGVITFRNSGRHSFKKAALNRSVKFEINYRDKLNQFFGTDL